MGLAVSRQIPWLSNPTFLDSAQQSHGGLLPGVIEKRLAIRPAIAHDFVKRLHGFFIQGIVGILRDEPTVGVEGRYSGSLGKVGSPLEVVNPFPPPFARDYANGERALVKVPNHSSGAQGGHC